MLRVVVLISGAGSNLRALLAALRERAEGPDPIPAEIVAIGADRDDANLALADEHGIASFVVRPGDFPDRAAWGDALLAAIEPHRPDLTVLSGFMRLVPPRVVRALSPRLVNTHPAYLPEFPGAHAVRDALAAGARETGASLIIVDDGVDTGPILDRRRLAIEPGDDEASLHARIKLVERAMLLEAIERIAAGELKLEAPAPAPAPTPAFDGSATQPPSAARPDPEEPA